MKKLIVVVALLLPTATAAAQEVSPPAVDVVFCIDCSGSMSDIIETAKRKVWSIVTEIAKAKPTPRLRIGLIGYGNADREHRFFPLTDNLDEVYQNLVTFKVEGWGDEWVGLAIKKATEEMTWSSGKDALKIIFVAGNETARQGSENLLYTVTAPEAIRRGIVVNTIYCGNPSADEESTWRETAKLAEGMYTAIDQSGGAVTIETPFDKLLGEMTGKVNGTYLPYGSDGARHCENQRAQDDNSKDNGGASNFADRALAKNWDGYNCAIWDLVDACKNAAFQLEDLKPEDLPEAMRSMTLEERRAHIAMKAKEREAIQKEIAELGVKRQKHIDEELKKLGSDKDRAFDEIVRRMIREQAAEKNFRFE